MTIKKINRKTVPTPLHHGRQPSPATLAVRGLTPRAAYRFTCKDKTELARVAQTVRQTAWRDGTKIRTVTHGTDFFVSLSV